MQRSRGVDYLQRLGWRTSIERCWYCGHRQIAIAPADAPEQTQCAGCGLTTALVSEVLGDVATFDEVRRA